MRVQTLHRVDRAVLDEAMAAFKPREITPTTGINEIMFDAGATKVLNWMDKKITDLQSKSTIQGTDEAEKLPTGLELALRKASKL